MGNRDALGDEVETDLRRMRALVDTYTTKLIDIANDRDEAARMLRERLRAIDELRLSIDPDLYRLIDGPDLLKSSADILARKPSFKARCLAILTELGGTPIPASKLQHRIEQENRKKFSKTIALTTLSRLVASGEVLRTPHGYAIADKANADTRGLATVDEVKSYVRSLLLKHGPLTVSAIYEILRKSIIVPGENPETNIHTMLSKDSKNFVRTKPSTYSLPEIEALQERNSRQNKHIGLRRVSRPGNDI